MYLTARNNMYNLINEMFRSPFFTAGENTNSGAGLMKSNIRELENGYEIRMELPGFAKEDIQAELKDGYLVVTATRKSENTDEEKGRYIRRECFEGTSKRSFYVGDYLQESDIKAGFENGILKLEFPKEPAPVPETPKLIEIQ